MKQTPAEQERERSLAMMRAEDDWPYWPKLPLRRATTDGQQLGVLYANDGTELITVYLSNLHVRLTETTPKIIYADYNAVIADGWRVD